MKYIDVKETSFASNTNEVLTLVDVDVSSVRDSFSMIFHSFFFSK